MKQPTHSILMKTLAIVLFLAFALVAFASVLGIAVFTSDGYFEGSATAYEDSFLCRSQVSNYCDHVQNAYWNVKATAESEKAGVTPIPEPTGLAEEGEDPSDAPSATLLSDAAALEVTPTPVETDAPGATPAPGIPDATTKINSSDLANFNSLLDEANTNFRYTVTDENGNLLVGNIAGEAITGQLSEYISSFEGLRKEICVRGYLDKNFAAADVFSWQKSIFDAVYPHRYALIGFLALSVLACVLLFIYLMCAAGRRTGETEPRLNLIDRIPYDLYLVIVFCIVAGITAGAFSIAQEITMLSILVLAAGYLLAGLTLLLFFMSTATRIKTRSLFHNTVIGWCLRKLCTFFRYLGRGIAAFAGNRSLLTKVLLGIIVLGIVEIILLLSAQNSGAALLLFALFNAGLVAVLCRAALQGKALIEAGERLKNGDFSQPVNTEKMFPDFKKHGENLNNLAIGVSKAVDERMKSERMKTDLITNVSHDLKTPLTSIVNYVDLLKKEEFPNEAASGYVEVLDRQAARLKKLTEDLVEASKASSGTLSVSLAPTNSKEAVNQSLAEYEERMRLSSLTPVLTAPEEDLSILADGRLLWRVIDNLLSNVTKYALAGTRVYIDIKVQGSEGVITVKNVSREPLNIPPEDLMERFVRGDQSRATEGSGLGLSIAKSLVELMKGTMNLTISGDLFTAELRFPKV